MEDPKQPPKFSGACWLPEPESIKSWQAKHSRLAKTFQETEADSRDPLRLASLLEGMSIYGHDGLGSEIAEIIRRNVRRKHNQYTKALQDRDMPLMIEAALNDDEFRIELLKTVNKTLKGGSQPFDLEERGKIEITNAVMNLYDAASDSKDASGRGSYDRLYKRVERAQKKASKRV